MSYPQLTATLIVSITDNFEETNARITQFMNVIFTNETGLATRIPYDKVKEHVMKQECIQYCLLHAQCNVVYIAFKNNSKLLKWCSYYQADLMGIKIINSSDSVPSYWVSLWQEMGGKPEASELMITGIIIISWHGFRIITPLLKLYINHFAAEHVMIKIEQKDIKTHNYIYIRK